MSESNTLDPDDTEELSAPNDEDAGSPRRKKNVRPRELKYAILNETIKRIKGRVKEKKIAILDIETVNYVRPYAVGFLTAIPRPEFSVFEGEVVRGKRVISGPSRWKCIDDFLNHVLTPSYAGLQIYAHNGGRFDFSFLFRRLVDPVWIARGFVTRSIPIQSCMFKIEITHPASSANFKWSFYDSMRLMPMSLDKAGVQLGVGRKMDARKALGLSDSADLYEILAQPKNAPVMRKYLEQDCRVLFDVVTTYQRFVNRLGAEMKATTPATTLDLFRRVFQKKDIYTNRHFASCPDLHPSRKGEAPTCDGCGHAFSRRALTGGRTEIFTMKSPRGRTLYYKDFNSMYAAVMREAMPTGPAYEVMGGTEEQVFRTARTSIGFVECDVYVPPETYLPPLPLKWSSRTNEVEPKTGGKLVFPTGRFRGVWDVAELALLAEVGGRIEKVHRQAWFARDVIFDDFVTTMYGYRDKKKKGWNLALDTLAKLFSNSLFGKFSQREEREEFLIHPTEEQYENGGHGLAEWIPGSDIFLVESYVASDHIAPQISAHITSLARVKLWREMKAVCDAGGTLFYCDTDSVIYLPSLDDKKPPRDSALLGEMKVEHKIKSARFVQPKVYMFTCEDDCPCKPHEDKLGPGKWVNVKVRMKGFGAGFGAVVNEFDFARVVAEMDPDAPPERTKAFTRERLVGFKLGLAGFFNKGLEYPRMESVTKELRSAYDKRSVNFDGNSTRPLILDTISSQTLTAHTRKMRG